MSPQSLAEAEAPLTLQVFSSHNSGGPVQDPPKKTQTSFKLTGNMKRKRRRTGNVRRQQSGCSPTRRVPPGQGQAAAPFIHHHHQQQHHDPDNFWARTLEASTEEVSTLDLDLQGTLRSSLLDKPNQHVRRDKRPEENSRFFWLC